MACSLSSLLRWQGVGAVLTLEPKPSLQEVGAIVHTIVPGLVGENRIHIDRGTHQLPSGLAESTQDAECVCDEPESDPLVITSTTQEPVNRGDIVARVALKYELSIFPECHHAGNPIKPARPLLRSFDSTDE